MRSRGAMRISLSHGEERKRPSFTRALCAISLIWLPRSGKYISSVMKAAVILLGVFVALAAAEEECPVLAALKRSFEECKESLKPSEEVLELALKDEGMGNREVECFNACTARNAGLMKNAKFDIEYMESLLRSADNPDEEKIQALVAVMEACKGVAEISDDECEVAGLYMKCTKEKADKE